MGTAAGVAVRRAGRDGRLVRRHSRSIPGMSANDGTRAGRHLGRAMGLAVGLTLAGCTGLGPQGEGKPTAYRCSGGGSFSVRLSDDAAFVRFGSDQNGVKLRRMPTSKGAK